MAFTSVVRGTSRSITIASAIAVPQVAPSAWDARPWSAEQVDTYRRGGAGARQHDLTGVVPAR